MLVIMLLGVTAGQGSGLMFEADAKGVVSWSKTSAKIQLLAVISGAPALKFAPLAKTPKTVWNEFRSDPRVSAPRQSHSEAPQLILSAPELPSCPWVGVVVLRV